jgi:ABC-type Fe3+-hydroxamate transport system substrate-binding protein
MSNYNLRCLVIFGMLLTVTVTVAASSSLPLPVTNIVSAASTTSGANETASTATSTGSSSNNMTGVTFLFIQGAQSGSLSEVNATTSTLELSDVSDKTIMFSDRPNRIVASIDTADFIGNWSTGANSFAADPPNVALVVDDDEVEQRQDLAVIELFNPVYDSEANTLKYDIIAENATSIGLPSEFEQSTLVIDDDGEGDGDDDGVRQGGCVTADC